LKENKITANDCIAIGVKDIEKPKLFYRDIMGFRLLEESDKQLLFDTGLLKFLVDKEEKSHFPIPSFIVENVESTKQYLMENGCKIVREGKNWFWFQDPFGMVYDIIQK